MVTAGATANTTEGNSRIEGIRVVVAFTRETYRSMCLCVCVCYGRVVSVGLVLVPKRSVEHLDVVGCKISRKENSQIFLFFWNPPPPPSCFPGLPEVDPTIDKNMRSG